MNLPQCNYRRNLDDETNLFRCAHPNVFSNDDFVDGQMCRICTHSGDLVSPKSLSEVTARPRWDSTAMLSQQPKTVAVIVPCHNYGCYLREALESVLAQTRPADEILVVDDASSDDTESIARSFADRGVGYLRVDLRNPQGARRVGWLATKSDVLCFLDADDALAPGYLEAGLHAFSDVRVGIVFSDVKTFGVEAATSEFPADFDPAALARMNYMHAGCLVRREALNITQALEIALTHRQHAEDWLVWRQIVRGGWLARKQDGLYLCRRHARSRSRALRRPGGLPTYYDRATLALETVTLFLPLSGRLALWPRTAAFLSRQCWPHDQTRLILFDTSQHADFSRQVRSWLAECDYGDVRHCAAAVGEPGLADRPRLAVAGEVSLAMARIYNRLAREATTDYVWVLEDDILPPDDVCERLLRGFDRFTASVSAAYRSRLGNAYVAWGRNQRRFAERGRGLQLVGGNGFGCVVIRGDLLRASIFTATVDAPAYDNAFYHRLSRTGLRAKVDWSVECEHDAAKRDTEERLS